MNRSPLIVTVLAAAVLGVGIGLMDASVQWFAAVLLLPLALGVGLKRPEWVLAAFLNAGAFKNTLRLPMDLTVIMAGAVVLLAIYSVAKDGMPPLRWPAWMFIGLAFVVMAGAFLVPGTSYGVEKALRFFGLGLTAFLGAMIILRDERSVMRFMDALIVIGLVMSFDALLSPSQLQSGRLQAFGANTITLGRAAAIAAAGLAVRILWKPSTALVGAPLMIVCLLALAGSGSRGPAAAIALSLAVLVSYRLWTRGASTSVIIGFGAGISSLAGVAWSYVPRTSASRFESILSGALGSSELSRLGLYSRALGLMRARPFQGVGTGNFSKYGTNAYPHNLILEVGSENGLIGLVLLVSAIVAAVVNSVRTAVRKPGRAADFLVVALVLALVNSAVSGDINDNRLLYALMGASFMSALWPEHADEEPGVVGESVAEPA